METLASALFQKTVRWGTNSTSLSLLKNCKIKRTSAVDRLMMDITKCRKSDVNFGKFHMPSRTHQDWTATSSNSVCS